MRDAETVLAIIRDLAGSEARRPTTTGEPCALKVASTVRRGADGKGRSRLPVTADALRAHEPRHQTEPRQPPTLLKPNPERMINGLAATSVLRRRVSGADPKRPMVGKTARSSDRGDEPGSRDEWAT
jgi:hypothetical protein